MLILTRKYPRSTCFAAPSQSIHIKLDEGLDSKATLGMLFGEGPIRLAVTHIQRGQVKLGLEAHPGFSIVRQELLLPQSPYGPAYEPAPPAFLAYSGDARQVLAQRLRWLRFLRRWSQEDLADAAGLHRTYISSIERQHCNISLDNIEKLAAAFELSIAQLLGDSDAMLEEDS